jgi:hypothetical protein
MNNAFLCFAAMLSMVAIQKKPLNVKLTSGSNLKNLFSTTALVLNIYMTNTPMSNAASSV